MSEISSVPNPAPILHCMNTCRRIMHKGWVRFEEAYDGHG
jgi:hypothetical protein